MRLVNWPSALAVVLIWFFCCSVEAGEPHPLSLLPADKLLSLSPLLRGSEVALFESDALGGVKQITILSLSSAPPQTVHDVVAHPEQYNQFIRNMEISEVRKLPDGSVEHTYLLSYKVLTMGGVHRFLIHPGAAGPIEQFDAMVGSNGARHYRWEFLPAGSGTLIVMYGFTDFSGSDGLVQQLRSRFPTLDFGMGLVAQISPVLAMKERAEQLSGGTKAVSTTGNSDYGFLLDRGTMALMRATAGRLSETSLLSRSTARPELLLQAAQQVASWSQYVPSIKSSTPMAGRDGLAMVELTQTLPMLAFTTRFGVQTGPSAVDLYGFSGDLSSSRMRFDVRRDASNRTQLVFRSSQNFERASFAIRQLYKLEQLFEYGVNVGLAILVERGVRNYAERLSTQ